MQAKETLCCVPANHKKGIHTMRKSFFAAALAAGLWVSGTASAADVYSSAGLKDVPVYAPSWTGVYMGFNAGYGVSANSNVLEELGYSAGLRPDGGFAGGQIGYNWQGASGIVLGVEFDIQASSISDRNVLVYADSNEEYRDTLNWFGTVRGRLGYASGTTLVYATGGYAFGGLDKAYNYDTERFSFNSTVSGYAVGAGLEYLFAPSWSLKAEYLYLNFGKNAPCGYEGYCWGSYSHAENVTNDDFHTFKLGVNWHLGTYQPLAVPLK
jgi:outer membrane immunogenic protein